MNQPKCKIAMNHERVDKAVYKTFQLKEKLKDNSEKL